MPVQKELPFQNSYDTSHTVIAKTINEKLCHAQGRKCAIILIQVSTVKFPHSLLKQSITDKHEHSENLCRIHHIIPIYKIYTISPVARRVEISVK
jgi:hypothetical protein